MQRGSFFRFLFLPTVLLALLCPLEAQADVIIDIHVYPGGGDEGYVPTPWVMEAYRLAGQLDFYSASLDFPQLQDYEFVDIEGDCGWTCFGFSLEGTIYAVTFVEPPEPTWYTDNGLRDYRYGRSESSGTWRLYDGTGSGPTLETGTFNLTFFFEAEFPHLAEGDLLTWVRATFTADPGVMTVPGLGDADWSSAGLMTFRGGLGLSGFGGRIWGASPASPVVPEPLSVVLLSLGLAGLLLRRRHAAF